MAQQLEGLKLSEDQAEAIIEKAIEHGAYDSDMPDTKKEKLSAAEETIAFAVDAWVNDNIRPDDEDPEVAKSGEQLADLMELGGVEIDDEGNVIYGDAPEAEGDGDNGGDEEPFNPDDYIEGYTELSVVTKLKKLKELDLDNEDDIAIIEAIESWENEQDKPSSRILSWIEETLGEPEGEGEGEPEGEEPEAEEPEADAEPWEGYDKATASDIKKVLNEAAADEDEPLTREQVEYVLEYEQGRKAPRKRIIDHCEALIAEFDNGGDEAEEEAEPEPPKRGRGRGRAKKQEPEAEEGMLTISLNGDQLGEFDAAAVLAVVGTLTEQIEGGATSLTLELS